MPHPTIETILAIITTGTIGQVLLIAARAMPAPPASANYLFRWFYDFVQGCAVNADKIGAVKPASSLSVVTTTEHSSSTAETAHINH